MFNGKTGKGNARRPKLRRIVWKIGKSLRENVGLYNKGRFTKFHGLRIIFNIIIVFIFS